MARSLPGLPWCMHTHARIHTHTPHIPTEVGSHSCLLASDRKTSTTFGSHGGCAFLRQKHFGGERLRIFMPAQSQRQALPAFGFRKRELLARDCICQPCSWHFSFRLDTGQSGYETHKQHAKCERGGGGSQGRGLIRWRERIASLPVVPRLRRP